MTITTEARSAAGAARPSLRRSRPRYGELAVQGLLFLAALVSIATTVGIVLSFVAPTVELFRDKGVSLQEFLTSTEWGPLFADPTYGVLPLVSATLLITVIAVAVAIPIGLMAAVYLSEYASPRARQVLKPTLEVLAGIPTVVFGFFALQFVTPLLQAIVPGTEYPKIFNALSAGLVMGVMIVPTVASLSEDALSSVPRGLRDGAFALGSSRRQVSVRVVVPAALSGIVAAFVLGISRAIGETMIVVVAAGSLPNFTLNPLETMQTMTAFIAQAGSGDAPVGSTAYDTIFAVGSLLFLITLMLNMVSIRLVRKYREVYE